MNSFVVHGVQYALNQPHALCDILYISIGDPISSKHTVHNVLTASNRVIEHTVLLVLRSFKIIHRSYLLLSDIIIILHQQKGWGLKSTNSYRTYCTAHLLKTGEKSRSRGGRGAVLHTEGESNVNLTSLLLLRQSLSYVQDKRPDLDIYTPSNM